MLSRCCLACEQGFFWGITHERRRRESERRSHERAREGKLLFGRLLSCDRALKEFINSRQLSCLFEGFENKIIIARVSLFDVDRETNVFIS